MRKVLASGNGERKVVRRFLWLPVTMQCERRWLETAYIWREFCCSEFWMDREWATENDYLAYFYRDEFMSPAAKSKGLSDA
jgi:hypothetical protein